MRNLSKREIDQVLVEIGYVCDFNDPHGIVRISINKVPGPKALFVVPLDEDETMELIEFERWLKDEGVDPVAVNDLVGKLLE